MNVMDETAAPVPSAQDVKAALTKAAGSAVAVQQAFREHADKLATERMPKPEQPTEGT